MQKKITYLDLAKEVLEHAKEPLSYNQIWESAIELGLDKHLTSIGKTPAHTLAAQLYINIRDRADTQFIIATKRPTTFWLKERSDIVMTNASLNPQKIPQEKSFKERDLHPLLVRFIKDRFDALSKTIHHEKSGKEKGGKDKWNYPDIVSVHFPFNDYEQEETLALAQNLHCNDCKIYSFELKIALDFSNLKESYFQAVSNSSFANEGYLVVFRELDSEVLDEIRRLHQSFGIGLIKLESDIMESRVVLPSVQRHLDFQTIDMLVYKNPDFRNFIANLNKDIKTNDRDRIAKQHYDKVLELDNLERYIREHNIL